MKMQPGYWELMVQQNRQVQFSILEFSNYM